MFAGCGATKDQRGLRQRTWPIGVDADAPARAEARDPRRFCCWATNWIPIEDAWRADEHLDLAADLIVRTSASR